MELPEAGEREAQGRLWGIDPTLVTFFIPLLEPLGLRHQSTMTIFRDEIVPWLAGTQNQVREGLEPLVDEEGRCTVSMMVWRPKERVKLPVGPVEAMGKVFHVVTGEGQRELFEEEMREKADGEETAGTVITAVTPLLREPGEELATALSVAFDRCLEELNALVRAYVTETGAWDVRLVSRRNVFPTILYWLRDPFDDEAQRQSGMFLVHEGINLGLAGPAKEIEDDAGAWKLASRLSIIKQGHPLQAASEQSYRARRAYWVDGDYAGTVSAAYTAGEVVLNSVLLLLEWEKGTERAVTRTWFEEQGLVKRLRSYYHETLGGNWDPNNASRPVGRFMTLAELRGRVVHAGYWPTEEEAVMALETKDGLSDFVKARLAAKVTKYPRTALLLLGEPGLQRLGAWGRVKRFVEEEMVGEEPWIASFRAWLDTGAG